MTWLSDAASMCQPEADGPVPSEAPVTRVTRVTIGGER